MKNKRKKWYALGIVFIIILFVTSITTYIIYFNQKRTQLKIEDKLEYNNELEFGIDTSNYSIIKDKVKKNETLANILYKYNISSNTLNRFYNSAKGVFDYHKIKTTTPYLLYFLKDHPDSICYFIYINSKSDYYFVDFTDSSVLVEKKTKEIYTVRRVFSATISNSLWLTITERNLNPQLVVNLSEVYAWVIDFFMLDKNDHITVIYDENFVDSVSTGIPKIYAALFTHLGKDYYAIPFEQNGKLDFYDETGKSLKRQFLKAPLKFSRISSRFSHSRFHPVLRIRRPHHGVDYAAAIGTPVQSIGDGTVILAGYDRGAGRIVKIKHNSIFTTGYMHLLSFAKGIRKGAHVNQGQIIGYVGSSGLSTGPHLDFRFWKHGSPVDPLKVQAPPVYPVKEENMPIFKPISEKYIKQLKHLRETEEVFE